MRITRKIVAAVILNKDNKVLLCRRSLNDDVFPGVWHMPGGGFKKGESVKDCVTRELKEELGVDVVEVGSNIEVSDEYEVNGNLHHVDFYPVMIEGKIELNCENIDYKWVSYEDFDKYLGKRVFQLNKDALEKTIELGFYSAISTDK